MVPKKRVPHLTIAIPASLTADVPHLREKTQKIGLLARTAVIFRVDEIVIYPDISYKSQIEDLKFVSIILSYLDTPQYLRRALFPLSSILRYVGTLPPLRTPHHPLTKKAEDLQPGQFREGVVIQSDNSQTFLDIGVDKLAIIRETKLPCNTRVVVQISSIGQGPPEVILQQREEINIYWGYKVTVSNHSLGKIINKGNYDFTVLTSKYGKHVTKAFKEIKDTWNEIHNVLVAFGSPREGLSKILKREKRKIHMPHVMVNTIPRQGTETVRTEEAVSATLALLNVINEKGVEEDG